MSIQNRLKRLETQLDTSAETVDRLIERMELRAEVRMHPELVAAIERANIAAREAGLPERTPPEMSEAAKHLAEVDTAEQAEADTKRFRQLVQAGAVSGDGWRLKDGGLTPAPEPYIAAAGGRQDPHQRSAGGGAADGGARS